MRASTVGGGRPSYLSVCQTRSSETHSHLVCQGPSNTSLSPRPVPTFTSARTRRAHPCNLRTRRNGTCPVASHSRQKLTYLYLRPYTLPHPLKCLPESYGRTYFGLVPHYPSNSTDLLLRPCLLPYPNVYLQSVSSLTQEILEHVFEVLKASDTTI